VPHGDHVDYLVDGHLHHPHGNHCDNHGPITLA
jgi:UDP-2,3-diacylglucosamine pyrophosphatase LpxH